MTTLSAAHPRPLASIQVARGIAALAVVAYHASLTQVKYFSGVDVLPTFFSFGQFGVDLFFVISGFVMVLTTSAKHCALRESGKFLWNRFFRIYPTYWVYYLALVPVFLLLPGFVNSSEGGKVDLLTSFFLLPSSTLPLLLVAWTLTLEVWFYLVFAIILMLRSAFFPWRLPPGRSFSSRSTSVVSFPPHPCWLSCKIRWLSSSSSAVSLHWCSAGSARFWPG